MTTDATMPRVDLVAKLLARALDPAAPEPEQLNSAEKMVRVARRDGIGLVDIAKHLAVIHPNRVRPKRKKLKRPMGCERVMKFGKHAGENLEHIGRIDPNYLRWLAAECHYEDIRDDASSVLAYLDRLRAREAA